MDSEDMQERRVADELAKLRNQTIMDKMNAAEAEILKLKGQVTSLTKDNQVVCTEFKHRLEELEHSDKMDAEVRKAWTVGQSVGRGVKWIATFIVMLVGAYVAVKSL